MLERDLGVDHEEVASVASNLVNAQVSGHIHVVRFTSLLTLEAPPKPN